MYEPSPEDTDKAMDALLLEIKDATRRFHEKRIAVRHAELHEPLNGYGQAWFINRLWVSDPEDGA